MDVLCGFGVICGFGALNNIIELIPKVTELSEAVLFVYNYVVNRFLYPLVYPIYVC